MALTGLPTGSGCTGSVSDLNGTVRGA